MTSLLYLSVILRCGVLFFSFGALFLHDHKQDTHELSAEVRL